MSVTLLRKALPTLTGVVGVIGLAGLVALGQQDRGDAGSQGSMRAYRPEVPGTRALVTSAHPLASMAGMQVLMSGGNAADAAVAIAATLNVVEPQSSGIGGNGFATYFDKPSGQVHSLSMAGAAPSGIEPAEMTAETLNQGIKAAIVPGNLGGLISLLDKYGTRTLGEVLAPAIRYAEEGHPVHEGLASGVAGRQAFFQKFETSARVFLPSGRPPEAGDLFRMPDYAATLKRLIEAEVEASRGGASRQQALGAAFDRFYKGDIADEIAGFFARSGGVLTKADLAAYEPQWTAPVHTTYRGYDIYSNPSTSRGGIEMVMQLNLLEGFDLRSLGAGSPEALHLVIEAIKVAKADVYKYVADPRFTTMPLAGMLSKEYAASRRPLIDRNRAGAFPAPGQPDAFGTRTVAPREALDRPAGPTFAERYDNEPETTSFSIVDTAGNAVAVTPTLGGGFGTGVVVARTGLLFNNGMRLGSTSPYPDSVNYVRGGQIPLLNNSPVIVTRDGKLVLAIGTPGGEGIGQTQLQALINVLDFDMPIQVAIEAPRLVLDAEPNFYKAGATITVGMERRAAAEARERLQAMGHTLRLLPEFTPAVGGMQGILVNLGKGTMAGGADPRRAGYAIGW
ncbi:MAG TPA: gamma-glutamyltransferase [Vicinamibacterales bacterium]|nr:gamma-glutamyltransferase [Vicinamibacterales bacterium]